jgi:hypothetical protein
VEIGMISVYSSCKTFHCHPSIAYYIWFSTVVVFRRILYRALAGGGRVCKKIKKYNRINEE